MIEQLKSAIEQLHTAWDNYTHIHSNLQQSTTQREGSDMYGFSPESISLLDNELDFLSILPPKIEQIQTTIRRARNYSSGIVPINALPPEIFTQIFHLVLDQPCQVDETNHTGGTGG